jgi:hypothetical protein
LAGIGVMAYRATLALGAGLSMASGVVLAGGPIPVEGTFMQNRPCHGDSRDEQALRVKITDKEITYAGGVCSIDNKQQDGNALSTHVTCKFKSGRVLSDTITFVVKDDKNLSMAQRHGNYKAVLNRCPG